MFNRNLLQRRTMATAMVGAILGAASLTHASSHREAPFITALPKLDGTDLYMFRSYETGRENYVTLIANYYPLQSPGSGPNYFDLETSGLYEIHIDNDGDSIEDITFSFEFNTILAGATVPVGGKNIPIPLVAAGPVGPGSMDIAAVNSRQEYTVKVIRGDRRTGNSQAISNTVGGENTFRKPLDNIGTKTLPEYAAYADAHIWSVNIPGCTGQSKLFVGQRQEGFAVNVGPIFDLVNLNPLGDPDAVENPIGDMNITTMALEIPTSCLAESDPVIGAWTTSTLLLDNVALQVSRLGMPLINEVVIGLPDKDLFNRSHPMNDAQFSDYVLYPTLPYLLELLFASAGADAPGNFPRTDLVMAVGGVAELNTPVRVANGSFPRSEMLRLNTSIAPVSAAQQMNLGVLENDTAGFPNGRRPGDDVVDILLRVMMGALITDSSVAPNNKLPFTDQTTTSAAEFRTTFPYLNTPLPGAGGI